MHGGMGNSSNRPKYGPGNTVVGEPIFLPDDAFPADDAAFPNAPGATMSPTPGPVAGSSGIAPTAAAEATTGEADGYGYNYQPNVSTPYPAAPVTLAPYPGAAEPLRGPSTFGPHHPGGFVPPPQAATRPRRADGGPSLAAIGAISFVVIGGLTTGGFLVARSASTVDDGSSDKPILTASPSAAPIAAVPVEDPNSAAGSIPTEAPPTKPTAHRPSYNVPSKRPGYVGPKKTAMPTATATAPTPTPVAPPPQDPVPTATQTAPAPDPTGSARHRRGN
jgi:hypothetical protein